MDEILLSKPHEKKTVHPSVTLERVCAMAEQSMFGMEDNGICLGCGADAMGVEPDARQYECGQCGASRVYGAEEILLLNIC